MLPCHPSLDQAQQQSGATTACRLQGSRRVMSVIYQLRRVTQPSVHQNHQTLRRLDLVETAGTHLAALTATTSSCTCSQGGWSDGQPSCYSGGLMIIPLLHEQPEFGSWHTDTDRKLWKTIRLLQNNLHLDDNMNTLPI